MKAWLKPLVFLACALPLMGLVLGIWYNDLGADPQKYLVHATGDWTLRFLLLTLGVTPLRRLSGWSWPQRLRRMLGLYTFFYASLHLSAYAVLYVALDWGNILEDLGKRPYITVGFAAFLGLVPLALTSTQAMMRRLGRRWAQLHKLVYLIATLGCLHFLWLVKSDLNEPLLYLTVVAVLLGARGLWALRRRAVPCRGREVPELSV